MLIRAEYENGILKPVEPLNLTEGQMVRIIVTTDTTLWNPLKAIAATERIAALPAEELPLREVGGKPVSEEADRFVYGDRSEFAEKKALGIVEMFGKVDFDPTYDCKAARRRGSKRNPKL